MTEVFIGRPQPQEPNSVRALVQTVVDENPSEKTKTEALSGSVHLSDMEMLCQVQVAHSVMVF